MMYRYEFVSTASTLFQIDRDKERIRAIWTTGPELMLCFGPWREYTPPKSVLDDDDEL